MKKVFLVSGGIDSFIAWKFYSDVDSIPVFVNYGQKYAEMELSTVKDLIKEVQVLTISERVTELEDNYIPNRNLLLVVLAATYYHPDEIIIAGLKSDNCLDKTERVFEEYTALISTYSKKSIKVTSPFWHKTKAEIVQEFVDRGLDRKDLLNTYSCYEGKSLPCNSCKACLRRKQSLKNIL